MGDQERSRQLPTKNRAQITVPPHPPPPTPPPRFFCCFATQAYNDNDLAPNTSIAAADAQRLGFNFWEKRTMTNDFATVVHRIKSLGECGRTGGAGGGRGGGSCWQQWQQQRQQQDKVRELVWQDSKEGGWRWCAVVLGGGGGCHESQQRRLEWQQRQQQQQW